MDTDIAGLRVRTSVVNMRGRRLLPAVFAAGAISLGAVLAIGPSHSGSSARAGASPAPRGIYSALARPNAASVSATTLAAASAVPADVRIDPSATRLARSVGAHDVYILAGTDTVCVVSRVTASTGAVFGSKGCGPVSPLADAHSLLGSVDVGEHGMLILTFLVPDGVNEVELDVRGGGSERLSVVNNTVVAETSTAPTALRWKAPDGTRQTQDLSGMPLTG